MPTVARVVNALDGSEAAQQREYAVRRRRDTVPVVYHAVPVGDLWLPWFVLRSDPSVPVTNLRAQFSDAQQLRIRNLALPSVWTALSVADPADPGAPVHTARIEQAMAGLGESVTFIAPAWEVDERGSVGFVLLDGCHRASAIHLRDPGAVADVLIPPHLDDLVRAPTLRERELPTVS